MSWLNISGNYRIIPNYRTVRLGLSKLLRKLVVKYVSTSRVHIKIDWRMTYLKMLIRCLIFFLLTDFLYKSICCGYPFELHRQVDAIQIGTHNICFYKNINKKYTGCNLTETGLHDCALIGVCAVIRSNTVLYSALKVSRYVRKWIFWHMLNKDSAQAAHPCSLIIVFSICQNAPNEGSDPTAQMHRLIWIFTGRSHVWRYTFWCCISIVCVEVFGPVNSIGSCRAQSVYLTTLLLGRLSPLSGWPVLCTFFRQKLTTALLHWISRRERMTTESISWSISTKKFCPPLARVEPATYWSLVGCTSSWVTKAGVVSQMYVLAERGSQSRLSKSGKHECSFSHTSNILHSFQYPERDTWSWALGSRS